MGEVVGEVVEMVWEEVFEGVVVRWCGRRWCG
jgi:hypothetical protein